MESYSWRLQTSWLRFGKLNFTAPTTANIYRTDACTYTVPLVPSKWLKQTSTAVNVTTRLRYPIVLSRGLPKDVGGAFEKAPTLQAILLAIDSLDCQIRAREKPSYDLKGYLIQRFITAIELNMTNSLKVSLEVSLIHLLSTLKSIKLGLNEGLLLSVATITRIIRGKMTLSVGVLLCYTILSFLLALLVTKFSTMGHQDALEYLKWSYNNVNVG